MKKRKFKKDSVFSSDPFNVIRAYLLFITGVLLFICAFLSVVKIPYWNNLVSTDKEFIFAVLLSVFMMISGFFLMKIAEYQHHEREEFRRIYKELSD